MENLEKLVQMITDRLLENLNTKPNKESVLLIGSQKTEHDLTNLGYEVLTNLQEERFDYVIVEDLSLDAFLRVAALCPTTPEETFLLENLLKGKEVFVSNDVFPIEAYQNSATVGLHQQLVQQKNKLETYGVRFYEPYKLVDILSEDKQQNVLTNQKRQSNSNESSPKKTKLITEAKLRQMHLEAGDQFKVEKGMILTALAKDYLKRQKINII